MPGDVRHRTEHVGDAVEPDEQRQPGERQPGGREGGRETHDAPIGNARDRERGEKDRGSGLEHLPKPNGTPDSRPPNSTPTPWNSPPPAPVTAPPTRSTQARPHP